MCRLETKKNLAALHALLLCPNRQRGNHLCLIIWIMTDPMLSTCFVGTYARCGHGRSDEDRKRRKKEKKEKKEDKKRKAEKAAEEGAGEQEEPPKKKKKKDKKDKKDKKTKEKRSEPTAEDEEGGDSPCANDTGVSPDQFRKKYLITPAAGTSAVLPDPIQTLASAPFGKKIYKGLVDAGFKAPTAIQAQGWPVAMSGDDLIAVAKTGSGKTLAFLLPFLCKMSRDESSASPECLVLAPTRELAVQIHEASTTFGGYVAVDSCVVYGGVPKPPQIKALKAAPPLLVATPGRLTDLMGDGGVNLGGVKYLVLDEVLPSNCPLT